MYLSTYLEWKKAYQPLTSNEKFYINKSKQVNMFTSNILSE